MMAMRMGATYTFIDAVHRMFAIVSTSLGKPCVIWEMQSRRLPFGMPCSPSDENGCHATWCACSTTTAVRRIGTHTI